MVDDGVCTAALHSRSARAQRLWLMAEEAVVEAVVMAAAGSAAAGLAVMAASVAAGLAVVDSVAGGLVAADSTVEAVTEDWDTADLADFTGASGLVTAWATLGAMAAVTGWAMADMVWAMAVTV